MKQLVFSQLISFENAENYVFCWSRAGIKLVVYLTEGKWVRRGGGIRKGVDGKFSLRIVSQNHIPFFLV